ncbi:MAG TPA: SDR family oxidoreductase [Ramlibacter sp.]|nr:SDR family oxidoreductase [Ramlibacter sp.]
MRISGQRVLVVGGGSGIGLAVAKMAAAEGAQVVIAGRSRTKLDRAAAEIGQGLVGHEVDAREEASLAGLFERVGRVDHLVVTVGPGSPKQRYASFLEQPVDDARALFDNKFWAQYLCARAGARHVREGGSITLFGGGASRKPVKAMAVLAAVQAAIEGFVRGLALDLAPVRVNCVAPGRIASNSFDAMPPAERDAMLKAWAESLPVHRIGEPDDAAEAALFLMGNRYSTGNVLYVDGGHYLR